MRSLMRGNKVALLLALAIGGAVFALAFLVAPRSCEGGLTVYWWAGVIGVVALAAIPPVVRAGQSVPGRIAWAAGFLAFGVAVWIAGLLAANVRIICRLF